MIDILFAATGERWEDYRDPLLAAFAAQGLDVHLHRDTTRPETVDFIIYAPNGSVTDFSPFTNVRAVFNLWAGVETVVTNPTLTQPLCRMVDSGLTRGMVEWVTGHVLRHHLGMDAHIHGQDGIWREGLVPPLAKDRPVGILGLGALGLACGEALAGLGFPVAGWSRSPKTHAQIACHAGEDGLKAVLREAQILVLLMPQTPQTENLMDAGRLALLPQGAVVINPGRGPLIDDAALIAALDAGHLAHATLDVFRDEPLPPDHAFWAHPKVTVTPHIASVTRPGTAAEAIAENLAGFLAGRPLQNLVDRSRGY